MNTTVLDAIAMKNSYAISNGGSHDLYPCEEVREFRSLLLSARLDLVSQSPWRVAFKGHNKRPYASKPTLSGIASDPLLAAPG
jgi:hypothetical protein